MLDVHAPHQRMQGFKDFALHLLTITIGLLIALSLEGCVESWHHRQLVREAEAGLRGEIAQNLKTLESLRQPIKDEQKQLNDDLAALENLRAHPTSKNNTLAFGFAMHSFDNVAWKTAQTTGAFAYMPYGDASRYADIYAGQEQLVVAEQQVVEEVLRAASLPSSQPADWQPAPAQIDEIIDRIGLLRMRLNLLDSMVEGLDKAYRKFEAGPA
jgi:hypothetical protein